MSFDDGQISEFVTTTRKTSVFVLACPKKKVGQKSVVVVEIILKKIFLFFKVKFDAINGFFPGCLMLISFSKMYTMMYFAIMVQKLQNYKCFTTSECSLKNKTDP